MLFQLAHCLTYAKENALIPYAPLSQISPAVREGLKLDTYFSDDNEFDRYHKISFPCLFDGNKRGLSGSLQLIGKVQGREWFDPELEWLQALRVGKKEGTIGIHLRVQGVQERGDYILEYGDVRETLIHIGRPGDILHVFTDSLLCAEGKFNLLKEDLGYLFRDIIFHTSHPLNDELAVADLFSMASMDRLICSPSCFSWWGAWLGEGNEVYWPDTTFRASERRYMTDLKLPEWKWLKEEKRGKKASIKSEGECEMLVIIQSCRKYKERRETCRQTWLSHLPPGVKYFFAVGGNGARSTVSADELDVVFLPCRDDYRSLHYKTREMLRYALGHYSFDYLLKCDDDSYIVLERAKELGKGVAFLSDNFAEPTGGGGYFLSHDSVEELLLTLKRGAMDDSPEDVMVAIAMQKLGIAKQGSPCILRHCHHFIPTAYNDYISTHYVYSREAEMIEHLLYDDCLSAYCWVDGCTKDEESICILYLYRGKDDVRFVIYGMAKWNGKATYLPTGELELRVDPPGEDRTWVLEHTRHGYWEGRGLDNFSILTPLNPKELEELSLANS